MHSDERAAVGLVATNSVGFVEEALERLRQHCPFVVLRNAADSDRTRIAPVSAIIEPERRTGWFEPRLASDASDDVAQVSFTSGTEGEPKGVVLSHNNLADVVTRLNACMALSSDVREYLGVPVYHSFGFGRCRAVAAVGGRAFVPEAGFNPLEFAQLLSAGQVNALSAVPSLLRILLEARTVDAVAGARLRWLEIGSQYMSRAEKEAVLALFPNARIVQHYGLTEASRSTFLELHATPGHLLESVGRAFGDVELKISDDGRIQIRGPHVAKALRTSAGEYSPVDEQGWLTTQDQGSLKDGFLYFEGRADDVINCAGLKLSPEALEAAVRRRVPGAKDFAVSRVPDALRGDAILVARAASCPTPPRELADAVTEAAAEFGVNARGALREMQVDALPYTATGKLQRKELTRRYEGQRPVSASEEPAAARSLDAQLAKLLGVSQVNSGDTFTSLGGDSLRFIQASVAVQRHLGHLPLNWENIPIQKLSELRRAGPATPQMESLVLLRALAITVIVVNHSGVLADVVPLAGGAFFLIVAAGYSFARFQLQRLLNTGHAYLVLSILPKIVVPTALLVAFLQARQGIFHWPALFLANNFWGPDRGGGIHFWFIEVFVQIHLIFFLVFLVPGFRRQLARNAYVTSLVTLLACVGVEQLSLSTWDTTALWDRLPHLKAWYFVLGWCLVLSKTRAQRWLSTGVVVLLSALRWPEISQACWILCGGLTLLWVPRLPVGGWIAGALGVLASASLFIYITHWTVLGITLKLLPSHHELPFITAALLVGVCVWFVFERAWGYVLKKWAERRA